MAVTEDNVDPAFVTLVYSLCDAFIIKILVLSGRTSPKNPISIFEHSLPAGNSIPQGEHVARNSNFAFRNGTIPGAGPSTNIMSAQPKRGFIRCQPKSFTIVAVTEV